MFDTETSCCFTGHRQLPDEQIPHIVQKTVDGIRYLISKEGVNTFYVGGAMGYDTLAAISLFEIKNTEFPQLQVILAYPFEKFYDSWPLRWQEKYLELLPCYDQKVCISHKRSKQAFLQRDRFLVEHAAFCLAYCTKNTGGTAYTLRYAKERGLSIFNIGQKTDPFLL